MAVANAQLEGAHSDHLGFWQAVCDAGQVDGVVEVTAHLQEAEHAHRTRSPGFFVASRPVLLMRTTCTSLQSDLK